MLVFTHANFQLDLTYLSVTFTEVNQWFKDDFSTEQSFPFDLYLDLELSKNSGFQSHYNANKNQTIFHGHLDKDGEVVDAVLTFQGRKGKVISAVIKSGLDNFPSFDKKLSELNLEKKLLTDIIADANSVISKGYPTVNYNFRMIHTNKYDPTAADWNGFEKIINNYDGYNFLTNSVGEEAVDLIKNIMQPLPYLMHVIKTGIEDGGYTLAGDILTDTDLNRALIFRDGDYFKLNPKETITFSFLNNQWDSLPFENNGFQYVSFYKELTITKKGNYQLSGDITSLVYSARKDPPTLHDRYRCSLLDWELKKISAGAEENLIGEHWGREGSGTDNLWVEINSRSVDMTLSLEVGDVIRFTKTEPKRDYNPSVTPDNPEAISLTLTPIRQFNTDGSPIISVVNLNEIDLTRVVPDMTFRELITSIKNLKNYEFVPVENVIYMNLIENKLDRSVAKNLEDFDIEEPEINYHDDREYELSFTDGKSNETYKYDSVLVTSEGVVINDYVVKSTVNPIKIDALPLPVVTKSGITTAYNFDDQPSKLRLVFADPMVYGGSPVTFWNVNMTIPKIRENNYSKWLDFRINSIEWKWDFIISVEKFREITIQSLTYAYKNYHILTEIEKERLDKSWWRVTAKTESLE
jgi:hypothetical protein